MSLTSPAVALSDALITGDPAPGSPVAVRIADAAVRCIADNGIRSTTVEAIAAEAGVGRATVYRHFPGGRAEVILAAGQRELERAADRLAPDLEAAATLEDVLVVAVHGAAHLLRTNGPLRELFTREPEIVMPHLGFDRMPEVFLVGAGLLRPHLRRFVADDATADRVAEWMTRLVLSHQVAPATDVDLDDPDSVRAHLRTFVLPGLDPAPA